MVYTNVISERVICDCLIYLWISRYLEPSHKHNEVCVCEEVMPRFLSMAILPK